MAVKKTSAIKASSTAPHYGATIVAGLWFRRRI